jgi:hypothetical protein
MADYTKFWETVAKLDNNLHTIFKEIDQVVYSLSLKQTTSTEISYTFQEERPTIHNLCTGTITVDLMTNTIVASTVKDKYDMGFAPDLDEIMSCMF